MSEADQDLLLEVAVECPLGERMSVRQIEDIARRVCAEIAAREELAPSEVSLSIVDNETIQALNRAYRNLDKPTDVLSFAMLEADEPEIVDAEDTVQVLGDIVISWPTAVAQAEAYGHSLERELAFLTAHGFYHLLGYDHDTEERERVMFGLQESVLASLGFTR